MWNIIHNSFTAQHTACTSDADYLKKSMLRSLFLADEIFTQEMVQLFSYGDDLILLNWILVSSINISCRSWWLLTAPNNQSKLCTCFEQNSDEYYSVWSNIRRYQSQYPSLRCTTHYLHRTCSWQSLTSDSVSIYLEKCSVIHHNHASY